MSTSSRPCNSSRTSGGSLTPTCTCTGACSFAVACLHRSNEGRRVQRRVQFGTSPVHQHHHGLARLQRLHQLVRAHSGQQHIRQQRSARRVEPPYRFRQGDLKHVYHALPSCYRRLSIHCSVCSCGTLLQIALDATYWEIVLRSTSRTC